MTRREDADAPIAQGGASGRAGKVAWVLCVCDSVVPVKDWGYALPAVDMVRGDGALFSGMVPILHTDWEVGACEAVRLIRTYTWPTTGSVAYVCFSRRCLPEAERVLSVIEAFGIETVMVGDWTGEPEEPQAADSSDRLAADLAMAVKGVTTLRSQQQLACGYFGHACGIPCLDKEASMHRDECPAYGDGRGGPESCLNAMRDDIARRCESLGIDLKGGGL